MLEELAGGEFGEAKVWVFDGPEEGSWIDGCDELLLELDQDLLVEGVFSQCRGKLAVDFSDLACGRSVAMDRILARVIGWGKVNSGECVVGCRVHEDCKVSMVASPAGGGDRASVGVQFALQDLD